MDIDTGLEIIAQRSYKVSKANDIVQKARYDLNIKELKALAFIISKVKPNDTELQEYTFSVKEYCKVCGIDFKNGGNYKYIKTSLQNLRDKSFWIVNDDGTETTVGWLSKVTVSRGSGKIKVELDRDLQKYVVGLFEDFTQYELFFTLPMRSSYSFRIYELLKSYAFRKQYTFEIDELKRRLSAEHYVNFKDFRKYVLEVATREINEYTDLETVWEPIKNGRKVEKVKFTIRYKTNADKLKAITRTNRELDGQMSLIDAFPNEEYWKK